MNFQFHTFGCKVNTYDTGLIQKNLKQYNFNKDIKFVDGGSQVHILNTCAVTAEATKEAVRTIRKIKAHDPFSLVVVTGCAAQVDTDAFTNLPGADLIIANSHKGMLPQIVEQYYKGNREQKLFKSNIFAKEDLEAGGGLEKSHTRSFLKIQDGCNSFCTYCVIPFARGKSRSISIKNLVDKVNELYIQGLREVVLTGVHIGDYLDESLSVNNNLESLVESLLAKTRMPRFRLSSLEPVELTDKLLDLYSDERMCPHFHMSIQSANTNVLHHMKRKYTQQDVANCLNNIAKRVKNAYVGMDVIVGFPTETEAEFEDTYQTLANLPWTRIHVFPYSERSGTYAARLKETVLLHERHNRAQRLRELSLHRLQSEALKQQNSTKKVLILKSSAKGAQGLSRCYWPVKIDNEKLVSENLGQEIEVKVGEYVLPPTKIEGYFLYES